MRRMLLSSERFATRPAAAKSTVTCGKPATSIWESGSRHYYARRENSGGHSTARVCGQLFFGRNRGRIAFPVPSNWHLLKSNLEAACGQGPGHCLDCEVVITAEHPRNE